MCVHVLHSLLKEEHIRHTLSAPTRNGGRVTSPCESILGAQGACTSRAIPHRRLIHFLPFFRDDSQTKRNSGREGSVGCSVVVVGGPEFVLSVRDRRWMGEGGSPSSSPSTSEGGRTRIVGWKKRGGGGSKQAISIAGDDERKEGGGKRRRRRKKVIHYSGSEVTRQPPLPLLHRPRSDAGFSFGPPHQGRGEGQC